MAKQILNSSRQQELSHLTELIDVTSTALSTLEVANRTGNHVGSAFVEQVAADLVAMVGRAREIIIPK